MVIREIRESDFESALTLFKELDKMHVANRAEIRPNIVSNDFRLNLLDAICMKERREIILVAEINSEVAGLAKGQIQIIEKHPVLKDNVIGHLDDLIVKSEYTNSGVGTELMKEMEAKLFSMGANKIELKVFNFNHPAMHFYEKLGYTPKCTTYEK